MHAQQDRAAQSITLASTWKILDILVETLEAQGAQSDGVGRQLPGTTVKSVFLTDPWETRIELTEGLAPE